MKRKLPREEKEEKKNKKAKRMKTKEEQKADKNKKEEKEKLEQKENKTEKNKSKAKVEKLKKKQKKEIEEEKKSQQKEEIIEKQQEEKLQDEQMKQEEQIKEKIKEEQQKEIQVENKKEQEDNQEETKKEQQEDKQKEIQGKNKKEQQEEQQKEKQEENKKDLMIKGKTLNELQLEKIEKEIKTQSLITEEKKNKIHKKIFQNILIAIGIVLYFIFINLGFTNISPETFSKDLQVFSIISIIFTIVLMEKAYKKDNNELTIHTIETLVFSICTLLTIYIRNYYSDKFMWIINTISILFAIYYVGKCIIIDYKMTKKAKKRAREKIKLLKE